MPGYKRKYSASTTASKKRKTTTYKRRMFSRKKQSMRSIAKKVLRRNTETKRVDEGSTVWSLTHNGGSATVPVLNGLNVSRISALPAQGSGDSNRDGNDIYLIGSTVRVSFDFPGDRLNSKVRVVGVRVPKGYDPVTVYSNTFDNITSNCQLDPVDKDRVKVLWDSQVYIKNINPGVPTTAKRCTVYRKYHFPIKQTMKFWDDGAQNNSLPYDFYILMVAYDATGALIADVCCNVQLWNRTTYKDK